MTMDYSPWVEREIWSFLKVAVSPKSERPQPPKLVCMHVTSIPTCMNFLGGFRSIKFLDDHGSKGKFGRLKVAVSPKSEKPLPPKLVCMQVTSIPTCMNFLGRFRSIRFFTGMDYKLILSPKPEMSRPPKLVCMHATSIPTCIKFLGQFRLIEFFDNHGIIVPMG